MLLGRPAGETTASPASLFQNQAFLKRNEKRASQWAYETTFLILWRLDVGNAGLYTLEYSFGGLWFVSGTKSVTLSI